MYSEVVEALLAMGEYTGSREAFVRESVTMIQGVLRCSAEHADNILQHLTAHKKVAGEFTRGEELPLPPTGIPIARWYWYVPPAA
jgi:hypothetical protein